MQRSASDEAVAYADREPFRGHHDGPSLQWLTIESPGQSVLLDDDDRVLDSHFLPEFDAWEVLVLVRPTAEEE